MNTPITKLVKLKKSSKFPVNQEVTKNADGSGGPIDSVAKQVSKPPKKMMIKATVKNIHPDNIQGKVFSGPKDVPQVPYTQKQIDTMSQKTRDAKLPIFYTVKPEVKKDSIAKKKDACYHKAKAKYDVFPSAYASGYIAKCRKKKGKIG